MVAAGGVLDTGVGIVLELLKAAGGTVADAQGEGIGRVGVYGGRVGRAPPALAGMLIGPFGPII